MGREPVMSAAEVNVTKSVASPMVATAVSTEMAAAMSTTVATATAMTTSVSTASRQSRACQRAGQRDHCKSNGRSQHRILPLIHFSKASDVDRNWNQPAP